MRHTGTGIRDPRPDRARLDKLLSYADANGALGPAEFMEAGKWFDANPHPESHEPFNAKHPVGS